MTRTTAKYLGLLVLATLLFYWKTTLTNQYTLIIGSEGVNQTYGWLHFWLNSLWHGHIPLWDPYNFGGRPFSGEMQTAAYYPLRLLFALVPLNKNGLVSPRFYFEELAFTHLLSAVFMFGFLRQLRRSHYSSFIGAFAFAMGGLMVRMSWPHYVESGIWLPAVLFFLVRALRAKTTFHAGVEAGLGGLSMGMSLLTGGVQFSLMQAIVVVTSLAYYGVVHRREASLSSVRRYWSPLASIAGVLLCVAFCVGAAQLLPAVEYGHLSLRFISGGAFPMSEKIPYDRLDSSMWPESLLTGLFPAGFDAKIGGGEAWPYYIGVFPFLLAVVALWKCRAEFWVRYMAGLALLTFLYTLGEFSPLNGVLYVLVPYLWSVREASRFLYLVSFALAVLAAFGLDALLEGAGQPDRWVSAKPYLKWAAIACSAAIFLSALLTPFTLSIWNCLSLLLILASIAFFYRLTLKPATTGLLVVLAMFVFFDLDAFNWLAADWNTEMKPGGQYEQMLTLRQASAFIHSRPGLGRVRVSVDPEPNVGDIYGVQQLWGGGATLITDYNRLLPHEDLLNNRYHIKPHTSPDPNPIYEDKLWKVYEDKNGYPRAWLTHQTIVEPSHDEVFNRIDRGGLDLHNVAIVEVPLSTRLDPATTGDRVRFRSYEADSMALDVATAGNALLVLSEIYYPGWKATVNGQSAVIHKTDGALRGIVVPAGRSRVVLEFVPITFYAGATLGVLATSLVLATWLFLRRNRQPQNLTTIFIK